MARDLRWLGGLVRKGVVFELKLYRSLLFWAIRRRPGTGPAAEGFGYSRAITPVMWLFIGLSAAEIPTLHFLLPWHTARVISLVVGFWGLMWMVGLLASLKVHPHVASAEGLRVRHGTGVDTFIPWEAVASVQHRRRDVPSSKSVQFESTDAGLVMSVVVMNETSVAVMLRQPHVFRHKSADSDPVIEVRLAADEPVALVARAREHVASVARAP